MKTRQEIIRALIDPVRELHADGKIEGDIGIVLAEIYDLAGPSDDPNELSKLIFAARSASIMLPDFDRLFQSIAAISQDELMTRHRRALKDLYRKKKETARAWLVDYVGSELLADSIEREIEDEAYN